MATATTASIPPAVRSRLEKLGIRSELDLVLHLPSRYEDETKLTPLKHAKAGVPVCMLRLGAVSQTRLDEFAARHRPPTSLHSPLFYPDIEETLKTGVPTLAYVAMDLLKPANRRLDGMTGLHPQTPDVTGGQ